MKRTCCSQTSSRQFNRKLSRWCDLSARRCSRVTTKKAIDRESAYEKLQARAGEKTQSAGAAPVVPGEAAPAPAQPSVLAEALGTVTAAFQPTVGPRGGVHDSLSTSLAKSAMRAASSQLGRQIARGLLGGILGGSGRRR